MTKMALEQITVVKIGGNVIDNSEALARFVEAFSKISLAVLSSKDSCTRPVRSRRSTKIRPPRSR